MATDTTTSIMTSVPMTAPVTLSPAVTSLLPQDLSTGPSSRSSSSGQDDQGGKYMEDPLLDLYYRYFHKGHPCAIPARYMTNFITPELIASVPGLSLLLGVMRFIGSVYSKKVASEPLEESVRAIIAERSSAGALDASPFEVQAITLYSIAAFWFRDDAAAKAAMATASGKAIALGMNMRGFAEANAGGNPIVAESWRRTWYTLYLVDAHIASSTHDQNFGTSQRIVPATVDLPCEDSEYESGVSRTVLAQVEVLH